LDKKRILWVGDAVSPTGFSKATHHVCDAFHRAEFEVHILGVNFYGDPHDYPYKIYPSMPGGDFMGFGRIKGMVKAIDPAVVFIQTDPWHVSSYLKALGEHSVPVIGVIAIDGINAKGVLLNDLDHVVFWTEFAQKEATQTGYTGPSTIIPLGVDQNIYYPADKAAARASFDFPTILKKRGFEGEPFIIGVVGRNQWRKRLDLTLEYFAEWVSTYPVDDAFLWLHAGSTNRDAWDLQDLARYYGVTKRVLIPKLGAAGFSEEQMARLYNCFDVLLTTTMGEGFGLPMFEAMACGVPLVAPDWSALGELADGYATLVRCSSTAVHPEQTNTVGGVMDKHDAVYALAELYNNPERREEMSKKAVGRFCNPRFDWICIGDDYLELVANITESVSV
jgi:D-inositol-3-phosphate glycosyltransferase